MSKFAGIIAEARKPEIQTVKPEGQKTRKPALQKKTKLASEPVEKAVKLAPVVKEEDVNLTVKVPRSRRMHWAAEAKRSGVTLTEVICEALSKRFGEPNNK
jgi:hypothetical protein